MDMRGFQESAKRIPVTGLADGVENDYAVDFINNFYYRFVKGRWVRSTIQNMVGALLQANLVYSSDGDANGLNTFLGTKFGTIAWSNPFPSTVQVGNLWTNVFSGIVMSVSNYLTGQHDPPGITDHTTSHVHVSGAGHWVQWDLTVNGSMVITYWNLRNRDNSADGATSVACEGSNDGSTWTNLNTNAARAATANIWAGGTVTDATPYRYIRIRKTVDTDYFTIGEIELYGTLNYLQV